VDFVQQEVEFLPAYAIDKRMKHAMRDTKKLIRLATVIGYLFTISIPAILFSIYYACFFDPKYEIRYGEDVVKLGDSLAAKKLDWLKTRKDAVEVGVDVSFKKNTILTNRQNSCLGTLRVSDGDSTVTKHKSNVPTQK
jgi:hypothetical protein